MFNEFSAILGAIAIFVGIVSVPALGILSYFKEWTFLFYAISILCTLVCLIGILVTSSAGYLPLTMLLILASAGAAYWMALPNTGLGANTLLCNCILVLPLVAIMWYAFCEGMKNHG